MKKIQNKNGILLFEVLLAVLVLSVGITTTLQAFSHILKVTKRSKEYYEAAFVGNDRMFCFFALPSNAGEGDEFLREEKLENMNMSFDEDITCSYEVTNVLLAEEEEIEEGEEEIKVIEKEVQEEYRQIKTKIHSGGEMIFALESFHVVPVVE